MIDCRDETFAGPALSARDILGDAAAPLLPYIEGDIHSRCGQWTESQWRPAPCHCGAEDLPANYQIGALDFTDGTIPGPVGCSCHQEFEDRGDWFAQGVPEPEPQPYWPGLAAWDDEAPVPPPVNTEIVDIYLSAGPRKDGRGCYRDTDYNGCSLWRIRIVLETKQVLDVKEVQSRDAAGVCEGGSSHIQPAVSPSGDRYAWQQQCLDESGALYLTRIRTQAPASGAFPDVVYETLDAHDKHPAMYPNWFDDPTILFSKQDPATGGHAMYSVRDWSTSAVVTPELGPGGDERTHNSWQDVYTNATPADASVAGRSRIVSFGGLIDTSPEFSLLLPQVVYLSGQQEENFDIPQDEWRPQSAFAPQCHHPAWSPDGTRILCTRYQDAETIIGDTAEETPKQVDYRVRRLFVFEWDGALWVRQGALGDVPGALVEALTGPEFNLISRRSDGTTLGLFPPRETDDFESGGCGTYVWKFAEWCASDRYLVATVYCTDNRYDGEDPEDVVVLKSRVVLIDTDDTSSPTAYTDLVTVVEEWLEAQEGVPFVGTWDGVFSTCTRVAEEAGEA